MLAAAVAAQGANAAGFLAKAPGLGTDGALPTVNVHYDFASEDVADGGVELARATDLVAFHARARALEEGIDSKAAEVAALARQEAAIYDALGR